MVNVSYGQTERRDSGIWEKPLLLTFPRRVLRQPGIEPLLRVPCELQVGNHALHLPRELRAALVLQLREDGPLVVVVRGLVEKQTLAQALPVKLAEKILVAEIFKESG